MFENYLHIIDHNRYLKINYSSPVNYTKLESIKLNIRFKKNINNKFAIICTFFLFKHILLKNGFFIILNKRDKKILGIKYILYGNLMFSFLKFLIMNFIRQQEIQNNISIFSFDSSNNYILNLTNSYFFYFEKYLINPSYKCVLKYFDIFIVFKFNKNKDLINLKYNNIFYLNFFKFSFNSLNKEI